MNIFLKILLYLIIFSILHFGYDLTGWSFLIPFCGINESIYQHLKIGFWAYLITILTEFFIVKRKINRISNFWYPRFFSAAIVPWMIFLIWFLVPAIFGKLSSPVAEVLWAVFSTYIAGVSTVLVERNFEQIDISNPVKITILILLIISAFLYIKFTYQLPWVDMFANPEAI